MTVPFRQSTLPGSLGELWQRVRILEALFPQAGDCCDIAYEYECGLWDETFGSLACEGELFQGIATAQISGAGDRADNPDADGVPDGSLVIGHAYYEYAGETGDLDAATEFYAYPHWSASPTHHPRIPDVDNLAIGKGVIQQWSANPFYAGDTVPTFPFTVFAHGATLRFKLDSDGSLITGLNPIQWARSADFPLGLFDTMTFFWHTFVKEPG